MSAPLPSELFDRQGFGQQMLQPDKVVATFKAALERGDQYLKLRFEAGDSAETLVNQRAALVDELLGEAWRHVEFPASGCALLAVGGYGRGELLPCSDVDVALLVTPFRISRLREKLQRFVTLLWDIGLEIGHSVRTVRQCKIAAREDITIATNLMEARLLCGDQRLFTKMLKVTGPRSIWPARKFFEAKLAEQAKRHHQYDDSAYKLEPNIKESPGCLRDIQMISWVAKRHFGSETLADLVDHDFLSPDEYQTLKDGQAFLWRVRFALHTLTGRREDRLLFGHQPAVAALFGFSDDTPRELAVESFMKRYYRTVRELSLLNELLLQLFQEAILYDEKKGAIEPLNKRFQVRMGYIEARHDQVFARYPFALLEIFLLMQQHPTVTGIRAKTIRLIRNHLHLIDDEFRDDLKHRSLFLEIIRQPRRLGHELQRMSRYGVLAAYLPVFEKIVGLMQFDLFHIYTVDEHTLFVVRNMRRFAFPEPGQESPMCVQIMKEIPKPELLYLAGLFHDIAKGRGGDHSNLGAQEAVNFCERHQLSRYDTNLVAWLVDHHLIMSTTAQRKDLSDPQVINDFAQKVGDRMHLRYLYLLTIADIRGTNPALWSSWKDALLAELYVLTLSALRRGLENPIDKSDLIAATRAEAMARLTDTGVDVDRVEALWDRLGEDYLLRHSPDEIAWNTHAILTQQESDLPLVLLRPYTERGASEIFIYTRDYDYLFAVTTQVLGQLGLTIADARIITSADGYTLDTYLVMEAETNEPIIDDERGAEVIASLRAALSSPGTLRSTPRRHYRDRKVQHFKIPTEVTFGEDTANRRTVMRVVTRDRLGILSDIGRVMRAHGLRLQNAKIATYGERVEDYFYITDMENRPIDDESELEALRNAVVAALEQS